jgi:Disulphide bond corrector protein DsbC
MKNFMVILSEPPPILLRLADFARRAAASRRSLRFGRGTLLPFALIVAVTASAQDQTKGVAVTVAPVATITVTKGKPAKLELAFRVASGYHINSHTPHNDLLIPTALKLDPPTDLMVSRVGYPEGHDISFPWLPGEKLNVYTGDFAIRGMVSATRTMPVGTYKVRGQLKYQACDDRQCYSPKQLPMDFNVHVQRSSGSSRTRGNPGQSPHVHR